MSTATEATADQAALQAADAAWKPRHNPWAIAVTVTLATFMEVLDTSIANVALPHIAGGLGASQDEATWVLTSYLVSNAIILPASAYLTSFVGRKRFYMWCVVLFGISSMLCGLAPSLPLLILFRVLQGVGGGGLAPSEQAILADTFPPHKRGQAFAVYGLAVVFAPAIGPTLGGYITDHFDWRWIFFINVPVAIISLFLTNRMVEDPPHIHREVAIMKKRGLNLDYFGFGLLAVGFGSLEFILDKGQEDDWFGSRLITFFIALCATSLILLIAWEIRQIRQKHRPILDLTLFRNRTFGVSFILMFVLGFALFGTTVLIPQFTQTLLGYTAEQAGMAISPGGFTVMLMMPLVGFLVGRVDRAISDRLWLCQYGGSARLDAHADSWSELRVCGDVARLSGVGAGVSFRADPDRLVYRNLAGEEQRCLWTDKPGAEYRGKRGNVVSGHVAGATRPVSSRPACLASRPKLSGHAAKHRGHGELFYARSARAAFDGAGASHGARKYLFRAAATKCDALVSGCDHRACDWLGRNGSAGLPHQEARRR